MTFLCSMSTSSATTTGDQEIAAFLCPTQEIEVADMEQIEGAGRITDADHCNDFLIAALVTVGKLPAS